MTDSLPSNFRYGKVNFEKIREKSSSSVLCTRIRIFIKTPIRGKIDKTTVRSQVRKGEGGRGGEYTRVGVTNRINTRRPAICGKR